MRFAGVIKVSFSPTEKVTCLSDNGILHQPGDMFNDEKCESRCECTDVGNIVCQPLNCPTGLIRRGKKLLQLCRARV